IEGTPNGRFNIKTSEVLDGEVQTPYIYLGQAVEMTGEVEYEGCTKFAKTANVEKHERPDGIIFKKPIEEAAPVNQGSDCRSVVTWNDSASSYRNYISSSNHGRQGPNGQSGPYRFTYTCNKQTASTATNALTRNSDNQVVQTLGPQTAYATKSTETRELITSAYGVADYYCQSFWSGTSFYSPIPTSIKNTNIVNWGW
ncbi:MAG: hypothetical protein RIB30_15125, partial [Thalassospira sp.]|uniref:hypothetical protein n=1 Tax=Thalassospira sp. TaxID=1912094 RepID=UPI0032EDE753